MTQNNNRPYQKGAQKKPYHNSKGGTHKPNIRSQSNDKNGVDVRIGQNFPLTIKRLGINGEGIGYFKRKIVFVPGALPDEVAVVKVTDVNQNTLQPRYLKFVKNHLIV